jgi:hypothetical protein
LGAVYWEVRDLRQLRQQLADRAARRVEIEGRIRTMTKRGMAVRKADSELSSVIDKLRAAQKNSTASPSVGGGADAGGTAAKNSDLRQLYSEGYIASLYAKWGLLFRQLGLSSDQIDKFNAIQLQLEESRSDLAAFAASDGLSMTDPDIAALMREANHEATLDLRDLLGTANYAAYRAYSQNSSALTLVNDLPGVGAGNDPLSDSQTQQLTQILANSSIRDKAGWVIYGSVDWQTAMPQAQTLLTPEQYEAFQTLQAQKSAYWQMLRVTNPLFGTAASRP